MTEKVFTITKEMLSEPDENDEIIEISDKEREDFLREITSISDDDGEKKQHFWVNYLGN